ncbi:MAG: hypothetical protein R3E39_20505 [Anaerolineae bacterium]
MPRPRLLKLLLVLIMAIGAVNFATGVLSGAAPPHPALRGFDVDCENQPEPCWFGIVPGTTTIDVGRERLRQYVYKTTSTGGDNQQSILPACVVTTEPLPDSEVVGLLTLHCSDLKLGDIAAYLGVDVDKLLNQGGYMGVEFGTPTITAWVSKPDPITNCTQIGELILVAPQLATHYNPTKPSSIKQSFGWCRE